jgi:hypothetical protein
MSKLQALYLLKYSSTLVKRLLCERLVTRVLLYPDADRRRHIAGTRRANAAAHRPSGNGTRRS